MLSVKKLILVNKYYKITFLNFLNEEKYKMWLKIVVNQKIIISNLKFA